ncbi:MAG TPA: PHB depolymerase family esterase [Caulobacteraceae bacterium]|nr:PHB depolymerase family esterase [Caulobacteraceae bacterium]
MLARVHVIVGLVVFLTPLFARADDMIHGNLKVGGVDRTYLVHLPSGPRAAEPKPLVIAFHGAGETAELMAEVTDLNRWSDNTGFIVAYPQGLERHWQTGSPLSNDYVFAANLIADLEKKYPIDRTRIIAAGMSNGAEFAQELGCRKESRFIAVVAVSATLQKNSMNNCAPSHSLHIVTFHGSDDPIVPYGGGRVRAPNGPILVSVPNNLLAWAHLNGCSPAPKSIRLPDNLEDGTHIDRISFANCSPGSEVTHYRIIGGGHTWPGDRDGPEKFGRTTHQLSASKIIAGITVAGSTK